MFVGGLEGWSDDGVEGSSEVKENIKDLEKYEENFKGQIEHTVKL